MEKNTENKHQEKEFQAWKQRRREQKCKFNLPSDLIPNKVRYMMMIITLLLCTRHCGWVVTFTLSNYVESKIKVHKCVLLYLNVPTTIPTLHFNNFCPTPTPPTYVSLSTSICQLLCILLPLQIFENVNHNVTRSSVIYLKAPHGKYDQVVALLLCSTAFRLNTQTI